MMNRIIAESHDFVLHDSVSPLSYALFGCGSAALDSRKTPSKPADSTEAWRWAVFVHFKSKSDNSSSPHQLGLMEWRRAGVLEAWTAMFQHSISPILQVSNFMDDEDWRNSSKMLSGDYCRPVSAMIRAQLFDGTIVTLLRDMVRAADFAARPREQNAQPISSEIEFSL